MIKLIKYTKQAKGTHYDVKRKCYIGYQIDVHIGGRRIRRSGFDTRLAAQRFIERLRLANREKKEGLSASSPAKQVLISAIFNKRLDNIRDKGDRQRSQRIFADFIEVNGNLYAEDLRRVHFQNYIAARQREVKLTTVNREMSSLSAAMKEAADHFPELEAIEMPRVVRPKMRRTPPKSRTINDREMRKIVEGIHKHKTTNREYPQRRRAREPFARMFELCWMLGLRFSEARELRQRDIVGDTLRVKRTKTGGVTILEGIPPRAIELLSTGKDPIFAGLASKPTLRDMLKQACEYAGVEYGREAEDGVTFHRTRHSFISRLVRETDIATAREIAGHTNATMTAIYSHATPQSKRLAMQKMYGGNEGDPVADLFDKVVSRELDLDGFREAVEALKSQS